MEGFGGRLLSNLWQLGIRASLVRALFLVGPLP